MPKSHLSIFAYGMIAALSFIVSPIHSAPIPVAGTIRSVAGGGEGDGGSALQASLDSP